jgi:hypothetical protein
MRMRRMGWVSARIDTSEARKRTYEELEDTVKDLLVGRVTVST